MEKMFIKIFASLAIHAPMTNILIRITISCLIEAVKQKYCTKRFEEASDNLKQTWQLISTNSEATKSAPHHSILGFIILLSLIRRI